MILEVPGPPAADQVGIVALPFTPESVDFVDRVLPDAVALARNDDECLAKYLRRVTVVGRTGALGGDDVIDRCVDPIAEYQRRKGRQIAGPA